MIFSSEEADFQKNVKNFVDLFLDQANLFSNLLPSTKKTLFWPYFCAAGKILKTRAKKKHLLLGTFGKCRPKNCVLSARASPLNAVYIGAE